MIEGLALILLPIFGSVVIGYLLARKEILDEAGATALNRFVYFAAFPAMLYSFIARTPIDKVWNGKFLAGWLITIVVMYVATLAVSRFAGRVGAAEMAVRAMNCTCSNTAFMGIPLLIFALGEDAALPGILATMVIVTLVFNVTIAVIEVVRRKATSKDKLLYGVAVSLVKNPLMLAVMAGVLSSALLPPPKPLKALASLLGNAAIPASLVAIGAFIARQPASETWSVSIVPTILKLLLHPVLAWVVVTQVVVLDHPSSAAAILLAALPSAASCFVIAKQHGVLVAETSGTIWLSTVLSVGTISFLLSFMNLS